MISYFYEIMMEREIESAVEQYQNNKFVVQANLITKGEEWFAGAAGGGRDMSGIVSDMRDTVAFFSLDGKELYSGFPAGTKFPGLFTDIDKDKVSYHFIKINNRTYLLTAGIVTHGDAGLYLMTGVDVERVLEQQQIISKYGTVYMAAVGIGILLILGLSVLLTKPVKLLTAATKKIAAGDYKERVAEAGEDEVSQLARNFNRMALAVEEKVQELSDSAKKKDDFVANFAHELKTPLTSIIGYANRIYRKELPREEQKQAAGYIWNEGMRLESLALKLMDMTLLDHKDFILQEVKADLLFQELAAEVEYLAAKRKFLSAMLLNRPISRWNMNCFNRCF